MLSFRKGQTFYVDTPFATSVYTKRLKDTCSWCFLYNSPNPIECPACSSVVYCSTKCLEKDAVYHSLECLFFDSGGEDAQGYKRFFLRTLARVLAEAGSDSPSVGTFFEYRRTFQDLVTHADKLTEKLQAVNRATADELAAMLWSRGHIVSKDLILEIAMKLMINAHSVKDSRLICRWLHLGDAVYLGGSKANHSCEIKDEYVSFFQGNRLVYKALKDFSVSNSLDLTISYIPTYYSYGLRQRVLNERYFFKCTCRRCSEESGPTGSFPTNKFLESFLNSKMDPQTLGAFAKLERRFAPLHNKDFYKHLLLVRLFLDGGRPQDIERSLQLGTAALEGSREIFQRMRILALLCWDMANSGANEASHKFHAEFKRYHELTITLITDVYGSDHPSMEKLRSLAVPKSEKTCTPSMPIPEPGKDRIAAV